eukprot:6313057-Alexandrium_andersonii.AAC.1
MQSHAHDPATRDAPVAGDDDENEGRSNAASDDDFPDPPSVDPRSQREWAGGPSRGPTVERTPRET